MKWFTYSGGIRRIEQNYFSLVAKNKKDGFRFTFFNEKAIIMIVNGIIIQDLVINLSKPFLEIVIMILRINDYCICKTKIYSVRRGLEIIV